MAAIAKGKPVLYQAAFSSKAELDGHEVDLAGDPDFLIWDDGGYVIRDCKLAVAPTERSHSEIYLQLDLYGWLFEQATGLPPSRLEVFDGTRSLVQVPYSGGETALKAARQIARIRTQQNEEYNPVGWSKCGRCGFRGRCWPRAESVSDVAIVPGVDQGLALQLHREGVGTIDELLASFDSDSLSEYRRPWGSQMQKVGKKAAAIIRMGESIAHGSETVFSAIELPESDSYAMFDLEGMPQGIEELDKIYLWGVQVFGRQPGDFVAATAGFGDDGDEQGWRNFLSCAAILFKEHGEIPLVHWHSYEKVNVKKYVDRYGDPDGVAARVLQNLCDLFPIVEGSVALPVPSYSLKVVERYVGFERTMDDYGGGLGNGHLHRGG